MTDSNFEFQSSDLKQRTTEQGEQICRLLYELKPIQTKLLGEEVVESISRGNSFKSIEGGRHLNFLEVIGLLSNVASLIQIAILILAAIRKHRETVTRQLEEKEAAKQLLIASLSNNPELNQLKTLLSEDPFLVDRILELLTEERNKDRSA